MQDTVTNKQGRKFKLSTFIRILLLLIAVVALVIAVGYYWDKYKVDRDNINQQLGDLRNTHTSLLDKQNHLEQIQEQQHKNSQQLAAMPADDGTAATLQRLYTAIDKLPITRTAPRKIAILPKTRAKQTETNDFAGEVMDELKSIVKVSKKDKSTYSNRTVNLELYKMQLKLIVNDMRWAWLYQDTKTYKHDLKSAQKILAHNFDSDDQQVQEIKSLLHELTET